MNRERIKKLQARIGTKVDGFWGPKSTAAAQRHLKALMPKNNPWPAPTQSALRSFYGRPEDNSRIISVEAPAWLRLYDSDKKVRTISCHKKVAASLLRALEAAYKVAPDVTKRYFGCHVDRPMRGSRTPSTHAYGAAVDLAASGNGNRTHWPCSANMPIEVMECFAREGWKSAGAFWSRDAMHFAAHR